MNRPKSDRSRRDGKRPPGIGELAALAALGFCLACWLAGALSGLVTGHGFHPAPLAQVLGIGLGVLEHPRDPRMAWPTALRRALPSDAALSILIVATMLGVLALAVATVLLFARSRRGTQARHSARWAVRSELERLAVKGPGRGRLILGRSQHRLLAVEAGHSVLVLGPTQSGKTSGLAIPALLEWQGPILATSVKNDLLLATVSRRRQLGRVQIFDPTNSTGLAANRWSPLSSATTWSGARRVAAGLCGVARGANPGLEDGAFWYSTAEKLLAPLLFAAAATNASMADVVRWLDTREELEVLSILVELDAPPALQAARASFARDERQRSSVYTTAETVLGAFSDPSVLESSRDPDIDVGRLLDGGAGSLFVLAPSHEQERLQPVFVALIKEVLDGAFAKGARGGRGLSPPLLVVLDEAANVAPLANLDAIAATGFSHGIELVTIWQDLAQIESRYGAKALTVLNNHRAKVLCSGIGDRSTLETMSALIGEEECFVESSTRASNGELSVSSNLDRRRLAPTDWLRRIEPGRAVLLYGHLPPSVIELRPYYEGRTRRPKHRRQSLDKDFSPEGFTAM